MEISRQENRSILGRVLRILGNYDGNNISRRYNGIKVTVYACIISMAITRTGEVAILVTCQYLTCGDCGAIVNTKGTSKRPPVNSGKP